MLTRNETYHRACLASEKICDDAYRAANQLSAEAITSADAKLRQTHFSTEAQSRPRRPPMLPPAMQEQRWLPRLSNDTAIALAAIQRHFANRSLAAAIPTPTTRSLSSDPEGLYAPQPAEAPIGRVVEIAYNGIKRQVRVDANGRVVVESPVSDDGWSRRGTFAGDAEAFTAAKLPVLLPRKSQTRKSHRRHRLSRHRRSSGLSLSRNRLRRGCSPISPRHWREPKASSDEPNGLTNEQWCRSSLCGCRACGHLPAGVPPR
jgi:hypothetical protein